MKFWIFTRNNTYPWSLFENIYIIYIKRDYNYLVFIDLSILQIIQLCNITLCEYVNKKEKNFNVQSIQKGINYTILPWSALQTLHGHQLKNSSRLPSNFRYPPPQHTFLVPE